MHLRGIRAYLSGPIECDDSENNWRLEPMGVFVNEFALNIFDPYSDPKQKFSEALLSARKDCDYDTVHKIMRNFVRKDLGMVDRSDFIIAYLPEKVPTVGTHHEIINAHNMKKPVLLVCPQGKENIPLWYFGFIPQEFMFGSWEDLYSYLREVDTGEHKNNTRWELVYGLV